MINKEDKWYTITPPNISIMKCELGGSAIKYLWECIETGKQNKINAYMWWKIASLHGDSDAKTLLQILLSEIDQNDKLIAQEKANECLNNNFKNC